MEDNSSKLSPNNATKLCLLVKTNWDKLYLLAKGFRVNV